MPEGNGQRATAKAACLGNPRAPAPKRVTQILLRHGHVHNAGKPVPKVEKHRREATGRGESESLNESIFVPGHGMFAGAHQIPQGAMALEAVQGVQKLAS